jgi:hypothetical protein
MPDSIYDVITLTREGQAIVQSRALNQRLLVI